MVTPGVLPQNTLVSNLGAPEIESSYSSLTPTDKTILVTSKAGQAGLMEITISLKRSSARVSCRCAVGREAEMPSRTPNIQTPFLLQVSLTSDPCNVFS